MCRNTFAGCINYGGNSFDANRDYTLLLPVLEKFFMQLIENMVATSKKAVCIFGAEKHRG